MTAPMARADPSTIFVQPGVSGQQICGPVGVPVLIYNADPVNTLYVGYRHNVGQSNGTAVQPQTFTVMDGGRALYGFCQVGPVLVNVTPGGTYQSPSAAQIALQLAESGIPILTSANTVTSTSAPVPLPLATPVLFPASGFSSITQPGYEGFLELHAAAGPTYVEVLVNWFQNGVQVDVDVWWVVAGAAGAGNQHTIYLKGPTKGNQCTWSFTAFGNAATIDSFQLLQNSRTYARDDWRSLQLVPGEVPGVANVAANDMPSNLLGIWGVTNLGTGASSSALLPLFCGKCNLRMHTASGANDLEVQIQNVADQSAAGGTTIYDTYVSSTGDSTAAEVYLPRAQCQVTVVNHNAAAKTVSATLTIAEY